MGKYTDIHLSLSIYIFEFIHKIDIYISLYVSQSSDTYRFFFKPPRVKQVRAMHN